MFRPSNRATDHLGDPMYFGTRLVVPLVAMSTLALAGCTAGADAEMGQAASPDASAAREAKPAKPAVVKKKVIRIRQRIGFSRQTIESSSLDKGETEVQQVGRPGVRVRVVQLTLRNGVEVDRELLKIFMAREPVEHVTVVGTRVQSNPEPTTNCDSNYTGACVPVASDVDCGGGSGDGPEYVYGPVRVVGADIYDLDRDGDGIACDT